MKMEDEDVDELTKYAPSNASNRAPISTSSKRELMSLMRLITENHCVYAVVVFSSFSYQPHE